MGRALALLGLVLAALLAASWLASERRDDDAEPAARMVRVAAPAPSALASAPREKVEPAPLSAPSAPSAREFLAGYYGERWPEIQARMEAAGAALDVAYTPRSWAEAEPAFRRQALLEEAARTRLLADRARWTEELTNGWLRSEFPESGSFELTSSELDELTQHIAPDMLEFELVGQAYCDQLDAHIRAAFEQGRYLRAPYTTAGLSEQRGFYSSSMAGHGWSVVLTLTNEDCPDLVALQDEMQALVERRDRRVHEFLRAHARR